MNREEAIAILHVAVHAAWERDLEHMARWGQVTDDAAWEKARARRSQGIEAIALLASAPLPVPALTGEER